MIAEASRAFPSAASAPIAQDKDRQRAWFALALPAAMAFLLALVPVIGSAAAAPFACVLVPLVLWSAFRDSERAIYVYIAWCWMDGTIRGMLNQNPVSIVARDLVLAIVVVGWGLQRLHTRSEDPLRCPPGSLLITLFVINCLLQVANPYSLGLVQSIGGLKLHLSAIPLLFVAYDVIRRREQVRALFLFLTLATLVIGLVSLVQYLGGRDWTWAHFPGTKDVISQTMRSMTEGKQISEIASFKPPGTTGFGGGTSTFLGLIFPLTFALPMLSGKLSFMPRVKACFFCVLMAFVVIILINSIRSSLVLAIGGVAICVMLIGSHLRARMRRPLLACVVLGLVAFTFSQSLSQGGVTDRYASTLADPANALHQDRQTFFEQAGDIVSLSPMGVGLGRVGAAAGRLGASDKSLGFTPFSEAYLGNIIFETGILGGILITCIAVSFVLNGCRATARLSDPDDKFLAAALVAVLAVVLANFFFSPILLGPPGSVLFWLLGGVLLRVFMPPSPTLAQPRQEAK